MSSRPIRYRVWSPVLNDWLNHVALIGCDGSVCSHVVEVNEETKEVRHHVRDLSPYQPVVEQWIGLTDRNGVDVYEGDIVSWMQKPCPIPVGGPMRPFDSTPYRVTHVVQLDPDCLAYGHCWARYGLRPLLGEPMLGEVIGNVHQHPHLLNGPSVLSP